MEAIIKERARLFNALQEISWLKPYPSQANFIYCAVLKGNAAELHLKLQKKSVLVRYFDKPLLKNSIRISVGMLRLSDADADAVL